MLCVCRVAFFPYILYIVTSCRPYMQWSLWTHVLTVLTVFVLAAGIYIVVVKARVCGCVVAMCGR